MASAFGKIAAPIAAVWTLVQSARRLEREQWLSAEALATRRRRRLQGLLVRAASGIESAGDLHGKSLLIPDMAGGKVAILPLPK